MNTRPLPILLLSTLLVLPLAMVSPAASQGAGVTDVGVQAFTVGHLTTPPTKFQLKSTICNFGTTPVAASAATVLFTAQAKEGPLRAVGRGAVQSIGPQLVSGGLTPGQCTVIQASWGEPFHVGEYRFSVTVSLAGDSVVANNARQGQGANPDALLGSGLGGTGL